MKKKIIALLVLIVLVLAMLILSSSKPQNCPAYAKNNTQQEKRI